jgi:hypothetical protein
MHARTGSSSFAAADERGLPTKGLCSARRRRRRGLSAGLAILTPPSEALICPSACVARCNLRPGRICPASPRTRPLHRPLLLTRSGSTVATIGQADWPGPGTWVLKTDKTRLLHLPHLSNSARSRPVSQPCHAWIPVVWARFHRARMNTRQDPKSAFGVPLLVFAPQIPGIILAGTPPGTLHFDEAFLAMLLPAGSFPCPFPTDRLAPSVFMVCLRSRFPVSSFPAPFRQPRPLRQSVLIRAAPK